MPKRVLVLHSSDFLSRAEIFKTRLAGQGHIVDSVADLNRKEDESGYALLQKAIDTHEVIVILVSQGLFNSCLLRFAIGYALGSDKTIVSVVKDPGEVLLPSWYSNLFEHFYTESYVWSRIKQS